MQATMNDVKSLAELDKLLEESIKYRRESMKLEAEAHKLWNESLKLQNEALKMNRERWWHPVVAITGSCAVILGVTAIIIKLFS